MAPENCCLHKQLVSWHFLKYLGGVISELRPERKGLGQKFEIFDREQCPNFECDMGNTPSSSIEHLRETKPSPSKIYGDNVPIDGDKNNLWVQNLI